MAQDKDRQDQIAELLELIANAEPWIYDPEPYCFFCSTDEKEYHGPGCPWRRAQHLFKDASEDQTEAIEIKPQTRVEIVCPQCLNTSPVLIVSLPLTKAAFIAHCLFCKTDYIVGVFIDQTQSVDQHAWPMSDYYPLIESRAAELGEPVLLTKVEVICPRCQIVTVIDKDLLLITASRTLFTCPECGAQFISSLHVTYWPRYEMEMER